MAERIAPDLAKRFFRIDQEIERLQNIRSLIPTNEDLEKYGRPADEIFSEKFSHGQEPGREYAERTGFRIIFSMLQKQQKTDASKFLDFYDIEAILMMCGMPQEEVRELIYDLIGNHYLAFDKYSSKVKFAELPH